VTHNTMLIQILQQLIRYLLRETPKLLCNHFILANVNIEMHTKCLMTTRSLRFPDVVIANHNNDSVPQSSILFIVGRE